MPIYEYRCKECGYVFEELVSFHRGGDGLECPRCHSSQTEKLMSVFASCGGGASASRGGSACHAPSGGFS